ncbi:MAG TPA: S8 family serine peptidase [Pirellulales bacterium]|jgi:subtilisin family serine protease|nr:S8 family serine peptidase [Pirellulales bacterium]
MLRRSSFGVLLTVGLTAASMAEHPDVPPRPAGKPLAIAVAPKGRRFAASVRAAIKSRKFRILEPGAASPSAPAPGASAPELPKFVALNLEFADADSCFALTVDGVYVISRYDRFADVIVSLKDDKTVDNLFAAPGVVWGEPAGGAVTPPPPPLTPATETARGVPEEIIRGGINGLTGKGVIVAVIDTGVDFHHPDFISYDSAGRPTSRLLYFWDTLRIRRPDDELGSAAPVTFPDGTSIGTIYSRDEMTADLRSGQSQINDCDTNGHGTACASIAAGNGRAAGGRYTGVAPDADIVAVRVGDAGGTMVSGYMLGPICDWLEKVAGQSPLVISCSFGGIYGGHDGFAIKERQLDTRFPLNRQGRAICVAAGNERTDRYHAGLTIAGADALAQLNWTCPAASSMKIYVQTDRTDDLQLTPGDGAKLSDAGLFVHPLTNQVVIELDLAAGKGNLSVVSKSGQTYRADAYLEDPEDQFTDVPGNPEKLIGTPGTSANVITVGSYNWNDKFEHDGKVISLADAVDDTKSAMTIGGLSGYSSPGFLRIGDAVKPEIGAPGQYYAAAAPLVLKSVDWARDTSGRYQLFNGTSAATPYTAGIVALMMQKNPKITLGEIKNAFKTYATTDDFTGPVPNTDWGYGKLDGDAVRRILIGKYAVWVYQLVSGQWVRQDNRTLNTDDPDQAANYAADVNKVSGWKATSNAPAK